MRVIYLTKPIEVKPPRSRRWFTGMAAEIGLTDNGTTFVTFFLSNGQTCVIEDIFSQYKKNWRYY